MQAKDIPDEKILAIVREFNEGNRLPRFIRREAFLTEYEWNAEGPRWCLTFDLEERMPDIPPKVILAKCRSLIKRGKMHGCPCGCRGDFYLDGYGW